MAAFSTCARVANLVATNASASVSSERRTQRVSAHGVHDRRTTRSRHAILVRASDDDDAEGAKKKTPSTNQMLVFVPPHPLINHWLAVARNVQTPPPIFRSTLAEIGRLLIYECARDWLPTIQGVVEGPMANANVEMVDTSQPIAVVPILRAGLVLLEEAKTVLPATNTYHLGFVRDETTLEAKMYLNKLPTKFVEGQRILISDPMLATGGTMVKAIDECVARGADVKNIRVVCVVTCPPALTVLSDKYPGLRLYAAMIDEELNDDGYIMPGLGDAGDRAFGTE